MHHLKNAELASRYKVSEKAVRNWIAAAKQGKLAINLYNYRGKDYVADTTANATIIEQLVLKGKKYKNTRSHKAVTPKPAFYSVYNPRQVLDIIANLQIGHELPRQYNYFDGGAEFWDAYAQRLEKEETHNILKSTVKLLKINENYLDHELDKHPQINVIDIGVGNGLPVKDLVGHLLARKRLKRYIALDISEEMLKIAKRYFVQWFGEHIPFEGYQLDINYERFVDTLSEDYFGQTRDDTANLILALGGTLGNLRSPDSALKLIHDSMGPNDLFVQTLKLDTQATRRYFDFHIGNNIQPLAPQHKFIVDLLNISEDLYEVEMGYSQETRERFLRIRLKVAISINFRVGKSSRVINFDKDDRIVLWRYLHQDVFEMLHQLDRNDFNIMQMSLINNNEYALTVACIKSK